MEVPGHWFVMQPVTQYDLFIAPLPLSSLHENFVVAGQRGRVRGVQKLWQHAKTVLIEVWTSLRDEVFYFPAASFHLGSRHQNICVRESSYHFDSNTGRRRFARDEQAVQMCLVPADPEWKHGVRPGILHPQDWIIGQESIAKPRAPDKVKGNCRSELEMKRWVHDPLVVGYLRSRHGQFIHETRVAD